MIEQEKSVQQFYSKLRHSKYFGLLTDDEIFSISSNLEFAILLDSIETTKCSNISYKLVPECETYYHNSITYYTTQLDDDNEIFMKKIANGEITIKEIIKLKPQEINDTPFRSILEKLSKQDNVSLVIKTNNNFLCHRCKNPCSIQQVQRRSADEPENSIIICPACGYVKMIQ